MQRQAIYIPSISLLSFTHPFYRFEVAGFQSLSKWSLFLQDQAAPSMNGISQSRVQSYATEWRGREDIFRTYNCNLICKPSANSCHVIARNVSATNAVQTQELHASVYLSLSPVLYYSPHYSTVQGCTAQYTLGEGRCCPDPEARTAPAQLTVSQSLSEVSKWEGEGC